MAASAALVFFVIRHDYSLFDVKSTPDFNRSGFIFNPNLQLSADSF